ncbi:MAG: hypothetical protein QOI60_1222 [Actinomycetota bacterium]|nr:hypothetical protein [Actinomycetota bacterium]
MGFILSGLFGLILSVVVARKLHAVGAGVFFSAVSIFTILTNVAELGADTGVVRFVARYRELGQQRDLRRMLSAALTPVVVASGVFAAFMFFGAHDLAQFFSRKHPEDVERFIRLIAPFLPFATIETVAVASTRGFGSMMSFVSVESIARPGLKPALIIALGIGGMTVGEVALGWGLPEAVTGVIALVVMYRFLRRDEASPTSDQPARPFGVVAREFWLFSAPRGLAAAFQITVTWFDVLMLEKLSGSLGETGIYGSTSRLVTVGTFALQAVRLAIAPQISALLARDRRAEATTLYQTATWWLMAVSWPLFLTLAVFAPFVLRLFGPEFVAGQHALFILSLAMLVNLGTGNVTVVLLMGGKSSWNVVNTAVALSLNVGLNLYLIPRYGMNGAAISWAVSIITDNTLALLEVRHLMGMAPFGSGYGVVAALSVACFAGIGLVVRATLGMSLGSFVVYAVVAVGVYAALLYRFRQALRLDLFLSALRGRRSG